MLSVIIPVFNRPKPLLIGLDSVLKQRGIENETLEIIVVDDHSDSPVRLEDWPVRLIRLPKNSGPAAARNAGMSAAKGEILAFLDSDDVWLPNKLEHQLIHLREVMASRPGELHAVTCGFFYESHFPRRLHGRIPVPAFSPNEFATGSWFSPGSTLLMPREVFCQVGPFDERQRCLEDFEWFLRLARIGCLA